MKRKTKNVPIPDLIQEEIQIRIKWYEPLIIIILSEYYIDLEWVTSSDLPLHDLPLNEIIRPNDPRHSKEKRQDVSFNNREVLEVLLHDTRKRNRYYQI